MQTSNGSFIVPVFFGERGTVYGCGHSLDTLLFAYDLATEEQAYEWIDDSCREAVTQAIDAFDWSAAFVDHLNMADSLPMEIGDEWKQSEYLAGDWLNFEAPELFGKLLTKWRDTTEELVREQTGETKVIGVPDALMIEINRAHDWTQRYCTDEWLHGDRSNEGVLNMLSRKLTGARGNVTWGDDGIVYITMTPDAVRDLMSYDLGDDESIPSVDAIAEWIKSTTLDMCARRAEENRVKALKWQLGCAQREKIKQTRDIEKREQAKQRRASKRIA